MTVGRRPVANVGLLPDGRSKFGLVALNLAPFFDADPDPTPPAPPAPQADDLIPRAEAKRAFEARDKAKKEADELRKKLEAIEAAEAEREAKAEEERLKKSGEWEAVKQSLLTKHTTELEAERKARLELEASYTQEKIEAAFLGASDWFGGDSAKTILTGDMAHAYLGKYVSFEEIEVGGKPRKQIVVRDTDGNVILDGKGNPAKFAEAIGELITQLPNKDRILRGSGKTGSGSSGGVTGSRELDLRNLTPAQRRDPQILAALRASIPNGGVVMGNAYEQ